MRTIQAECTVVRDVLCPRNMPQRLTESQGARNVQRDVELCSREFEIMYVGAARKYSFIDKNKKTFSICRHRIACSVFCGAGGRTQVHAADPIGITCAAHVGTAGITNG